MSRPGFKPSIKTSASPSRLIKRMPHSKRSVMNEFQAQHLLRLVQNLRQEACELLHARTLQELPKDSWATFTELRAYTDLVSGAYACGFVCHDFKPDFPIDAAHSRPGDVFRDISLLALRHYVHTLMRAERHGDGWGSVIYEALRSGALDQLSERLSMSSPLYEPL